MHDPSGVSGVHAPPKMAQSVGFFRPRITSAQAQAG